MPKGSKPGERRGGRKKGTPNKKPETVVRQVIAPALKRFEARVERVIQEYETIAGSTIRDLFDELGELKPMRDWPDSAARAVSRVEVDKEGAVKIWLWNKPAALDSLAKHLGMFIDRHEHSGPNGTAIRLETSAKDLLAARIAGIAARTGTPGGSR